MAVQYEVAYSASIIGAGVVAGGPYNCTGVMSGGNPLMLMASTYPCMHGTPSGMASYIGASGFAALGQIDPVAGVAKQKIYLFSGTKDKTVEQSVMNGTRDFYVAAGVPAASLRYVNTTPAGHAFISPRFGNGCAVSEAPYVNECTKAKVLYDQPGAILTHIYGKLKPKAATLSAQPLPFDQTEFPGAVISGMAPSGYVYIPARCQGGAAKCPVHVVFHGCLQSAAMVGDAVYGRLGYNAWADANGIVMLYPQVNKGVIPLNPEGCWDWWGYTGVNFQVQSGAEMAAVHAMIQRLTS
jgi:poly(3-hydroxybutyrate) depolymerase